ncbi:ABC transporter permease [Sanguibacter suaedae]|uniref:ABC transporter permease subunit n=1 Tax=Sanguibacter suaedae TaxID=2795737 RepID=A0A934M8B6_9MICO|nr:ABC transporter permease subunit [Sanguibacter suaedae]MBI9113398.1 ABC transporter permease subunit [Sanguibacter suaedae]
MDDVSAAVVWLNDPWNWTRGGGILDRTVEHLTMTLVAVLLAALVALPLGVWLGHREQGSTTGRRPRIQAGPAAVLAANVSRALPTFALLTIFATTGVGFGNRPTVLAAAIFALPVILANTYAGVRGVPPDVRDAARGMGMSGLRVLTSVELPLALPLVAAGLRTAAVQVVATIPLAALVGGGGLGTVVVQGFGLQRYGQVIAGGILIAVLCLLLEGVLAVAQRVVTPRPLRGVRVA